MHWVTDLRSEPLTLLFKAFTSLGGITFLGLAMSSGYWLWRRQLFAELILLYCLSGIVNNHLKETWQVPRPFQNPDTGVTALVHVSDGSWSFPSGHAQTAALLWGWFALRLRRRWIFVGSGIVILLVAASRVYLGVHYPLDVLIGMAIGLGGLALFQAARTLRARFLPSLEGWRELALLLAMILLWLFLFPGDHAPHYVLGYGGALLGFRAGVTVDRARWRFVPRRDLRSAAGILIVGLGLPAVLYLLLRGHLAEWRGELTALDPRALAYFAATCLAGAWISLGAPAIFQLAGWGDRRSEAAPDPDRPRRSW